MFGKNGRIGYICGMIQQKTIWNDAAKSGLVLGGVSVAYFLINTLLTKLPDGKAVAVLVNVSGILLWVAKFALCIWLMKYFMRRFAAAHEGVTNGDTFRFGSATALLSALFYSAVYLAWVSLIDPNMFTDSIDAAMQSYQNLFTADQLDSMEEMMPRMPALTFFVNLIYCWLFGVVLSAIFSRNIPSRNPFSNESQEQ